MIINVTGTQDFGTEAALDEFFSVLAIFVILQFACLNEVLFAKRSWTEMQQLLVMVEEVTPHVGVVGGDHFLVLLTEIDAANMAHVFLFNERINASFQTELHIM